MHFWSTAAWFSCIRKKIRSNNLLLNNFQLGFIDPLSLSVSDHTHKHSKLNPNLIKNKEKLKFPMG